MVAHQSLHGSAQIGIGRLGRQIQEADREGDGGPERIAFTLSCAPQLDDLDRAVSLPPIERGFDQMRLADPRGTGDLDRDGRVGREGGIQSLVE